MVRKTNRSRRALTTDWHKQETYDRDRENHKFVEDRRINKRAKSPEINKLSSKNTHGHFGKQHIWPLRPENKKGRKI